MISESLKDVKMVSGAGGGCFKKGTQVQLEGGKTISIEDLKVGDEILAFDEDGKVKLAKVTKVHFHEDPQPILSVKYWRGKMTGITPNHWVLNQYGNFAEMGTLAAEDALIDGMGHLRPIIDVALIGYEPVWNLTVEPYHTFIADGIRVHNGGHRDRFPVVSGAGGGGGGKGGGGGMTEAPDSLLSKAVVSILDLLGEGQIGGLVNGAQSVYFNDVPLQNTDGTWNFSVPNQLDPITGQLLPVTFSYQFRDGQQNQSPVTGFSDVETPHPVEIQALHGVPVVVSITNPNVNAVRLIAEFPGLTSQDPSTGSIYGTNVSFEFLISVNGLAYQTMSGPLTVKGKSRSKYQVSYQYNLPTTDQNGAKATTWSIQMVRTTPDSTSSLLNNQTWLNSYVEIVYANLSYPNSAMIGYSLDSSQFSSIPKRTYLVNGLYIKVPSNYDPVNRVYSGIWDGTFKVAVSNNPAWVIYDLLTNDRYGLGQFISPTQIDSAKLYLIGQYCDGSVPNGYGGFEPRFTVNAWIRDRQEAYKVISGLASIFNGMVYWAGGMASFMQDAPDTPVMAFTSANVVDGVFNYTGTSRKDRHSAILVSWTDPSQYYRQVIEYVEDQTLVAKYGLKTKDVVAFGCTSRGQAHRVGKWMLYTEEYQSDLITFSVGVDAALVLPGDIIQIQDSNKAGKRLGGRLLACTSTSATLDSAVTLNDGATATISIRMPDGTFVENVLLQSNTSTPVQTVSWTTPLATLPLANAIWIISETNLVPVLARVVGVTQGKVPGSFDIAAIEHNPNKYAYIEDNLPLIQPPTSNLNVIPAIPTGLTATDAPFESGGAFQTAMLISWDRNQNGIARWKVLIQEAGNNGNWTTYKTNTPHLDIPNVFKGQVFDIRVFAENFIGQTSGGYAEISYEVGLGVVSIVPAPTMLTVTSTVFNQTGLAAIVSWQPPPVTATSTTIVSYAVQYKRTSSSAWLQMPNTSSLSTTIEGLTNGVSYDFAVASVNIIGVTGSYTQITDTLVYPTLTTPSGVDVWAKIDANGNVNKIRTSVTFDTAPNVIPDGVLVFVSVFDQPNSVGIVSGGTTGTLVIDSAHIIASSSDPTEPQFTIQSGSAVGQLIVASPSAPMPVSIQNADFAGEFWAQYGTSLWRRISYADATSFYFDEPFDVAPVAGQAMNWLQVSWHDERGTGVPGDFGADFRLSCLSDGTNYEIIRWSDVNQAANGSFELTCTRGVEGTTPITADGLTLHYFPAPGPGSNMITIPASAFTVTTPGGLTYSAEIDANIQVPANSYASISACTYRASSGQVLRSDIIPAIYKGQL